METLDPGSDPNPNSPNKRLKTETLTLDSSIPITTSPLDKGKAPIIAEPNDLGGDGPESPENSTPESCGVCLAEKGTTFRGLIDSCDHYFCFLCIIEWSKIESRCPLCRGRFSRIRRVRKDGSLIGQGSVRVPVRDQIYDPFGEPVDPYAQAKCSVCDGTTDECLLLLCDLCDSASHTYCVGLGATVPEGDWYCQDCALLQAEQLDSEMGDTAVTSPRVEESSTSAPVSIFDIVRGPNEQPDTGTDRLYKLVSRPDTGTDRLYKLMAQRPPHFSSSAIASNQPNFPSAISLPVANGISDPSIDVLESSARTLQNSRNVHKHINVLRENWGAFRAGSLRFSFAFSDPSGKTAPRKKNSGTRAERSCKMQKMSSTNASQSKAADNVHDTSDNQKDSYNVDRAWKLMTKAKTVQLTAKSKSAPNISHHKTHSLKLDRFVPTCVMSGRKDLISPRLEEQKPPDKVSGRPAESSVKHQITRCISQAGSTSGRKHQKSCVLMSSMPRGVQTVSKFNSHHYIAGSASSEKLPGHSIVPGDGSTWSTSSFGPMAGAFDAVSPRLQKRELSARHVKQAGHLNFSGKGEPQTPVQADIYHDKTGLLSNVNLGRRLSDISDEHQVFACSTSSLEPIVGGSNTSCVKLEGKKVSVCPGPSGKVGTKISCNGGKDDEAKGEVQSLVKLNLKLLCKDKRIGVDAFKEIARLSTHTILASCGFEHRKIVRSLPKLVCHHGDQTQQLHGSTIVPSSCRDCFYIFVKDVVNSILSEKLNSAEVAS